MKQLIILIIALAISPIVRSQETNNLIMNGNFEEYKNLKKRALTFNDLYYWHRVNHSTDLDKAGTPDLYTTKSGKEIDKVCDDIEEGRNYIGISLFRERDSFREYIGGSLSSPLKKDTKYRLSLKACFKGERLYGRLETDSIQFIFSTIPLEQVLNEPLLQKSDIQIEMEVGQYSWKEYSLEFTATQDGLRFVTLGEFREKPEYIKHESGYSSNAYYFFDNIQLIELDSSESEIITENENSYLVDNSKQDKPEEVDVNPEKSELDNVEEGILNPDNSERDNIEEDTIEEDNLSLTSAEKDNSEQSNFKYDRKGLFMIDELINNEILKTVSHGDTILLPNVIFEMASYGPSGELIDEEKALSDIKKLKKVIVNLNEDAGDYQYKIVVHGHQMGGLNEKEHASNRIKTFKKLMRKKGVKLNRHFLYSVNHGSRFPRFDGGVTKAEKQRNTRIEVTLDVSRKE